MIFWCSVVDVTLCSQQVLLQQFEVVILVPHLSLDDVRSNWARNSFCGSSQLFVVGLSLLLTLQVVEVGIVLVFLCSDMTLQHTA